MSDTEPLPALKSADDQPWDKAEWAECERLAQEDCPEARLVERIMIIMYRRGLVYSHDGRVVRMQTPVMTTMGKPR